MNRRSKSVTVDSIEIISMELEFCDATDLYAEMVAVIAPSGGSFVGGIGSLGLALGAIAREFSGGGLTKQLARLLKTTTLIDRSAKVKVELLDSRKKLDEAFTGRQKYVFPAVKLALEVSFADFLDGPKLIGLDLASWLKTLTGSSSEGSAPSTTATGEGTG